MKQAVLAGRTAGLRPSLQRRLEQLSHRRHPATALADLLTLQRLAACSRELDQPLTLVVDGRGLCRLLWIGALDQSQRLLERLPGSPRRAGRQWRLFTCVPGPRQPRLEPGSREGIVGLDLNPQAWLRFARQADQRGYWPAALFQPGHDATQPWQEQSSGDLAQLCQQEDSSLPLSPDGRTGPEHAVSPNGGSEQVLLLVLTSGGQAADRRRIAELEGLVRSAGSEPVGVVEQRRQGMAAATVWGEGKLREAALEARRLGAQLVVTDRDLTPVQARNLERLLDLPVTDRSELILDIFAQRAASAAGRLQVELAQLRYRLPRLSGRGLSLSRQGGGIGTRGPGETQLEKDRRAISRRLERLQREVQQLGAHRARLRQGREQIGRLALVGYTNAGKSSLLNALTRASGAQAVLAEDKLFATLDPTTRRLTLPRAEEAGVALEGGAPAGSPGENSAWPSGGPQEQGAPERGGAPPQRLVTDTVGFIENLPPPLVEAFRSTLEEALDADGLLLVVDLSDPAWPEQLTAVRQILEELGSTAPQLVIGNQIDRCPASELERALALEADMAFVSATARLGLNRLRHRLRDWPESCRDNRCMPTST